MPRGGPAGPPLVLWFTPAEREELLEALAASGESLQDFCAARGVSRQTLHRWLAREKAGTLAQSGKRRARSTAEQKRAAGEAYLRSGRTRAEFAQLWGVSAWTLSAWLKRYQAEGAKGLEPRTKPGCPASTTSVQRRQLHLRTALDLGERRRWPHRCGG